MTKIQSDNLEDKPPFFEHFPIEPKSPLILSSPHSGRFYPPKFLNQTIRSLKELQGFEDAFVDELYYFAVQHDISLINANFARAYIDLNRSEATIDPILFKYYRNPFPCNNTKNGYGIIPRLLASDLPIYPTKLETIEADYRIKQIYRPYHQALASEIKRIKSIFGKTILIDCHSMPMRALEDNNIDIIISNRFGASSDDIYFDIICDLFIENGFNTKKNYVYSGGYITKTYGKPSCGQSAIQIEINRKLYMNEQEHIKSEGFTTLSRKLNDIILEFARRII